MAYEKMSCLYETLKDLSDRLHGTIIRYKGEPVYVQVMGDGLLHLTDIANPTSRDSLLAKVRPKDPDLDISSMEIGYINWELSPNSRRFHSATTLQYKNKVSFLERLPVQRYRQGLTSDVVRTVAIDGGINPASGESSSELFSEGFKKMIKGNFPSFPEAAQKLFDKEENQIALSIDFALKGTDSSLILVYYQTKNIGWIEPNKNIIRTAGDELDWVYSKLMRQLRIL